MLWQLATRAKPLPLRRLVRPIALKECSAVSAGWGSAGLARPWDDRLVRWTKLLMLSLCASCGR
jgi:hypothetical protein